MKDTKQRPIVLVVDDDEVFVEALSAVLVSEYTVRTASNGREALASVKTQHPDLIVLDVMMDHLSEGFDVARTLREDSATSSIPIILLTAAGQTYDYRLEVDESWIQCDRHMQKPVSPEDLLEGIRSLIG